MTLPFKKLLYLVPLGSAVALFVVMNTVDPTKNVASILLVFLLVYLLSASLLFLLLPALLSIGRTIVNRFRKPASPRSLSDKKMYYTASALAFMPVILLAMQSLDQVRFIDFFLVALLTGLVTFYILRRF